MSTASLTSSLASTARALVVGLGWAALMLFVIGSWMSSKYGDQGKVLMYIFRIAGAVAAGLAIWQAFTLWFKKDTPEQKSVTLDQQRRLFSLIFLATGLGLIGLAFVLGVGKKPGGTYGFMLDNLGESVGVLFFGLISLGAGYFLSQSSAGETASPLQFLTQKIPLLKFFALVLGIAALGAFGTIIYKNRQDNGFIFWLPELFALVALSVLSIACFFWLNAGNLDDFGIRLFVLVAGGAVGLILFCYSLARVVVWKEDVLLRGLSAWQGENAWRFWMCVYLQFAALVLMYGSFNLARADMRSNVHLRRVMYGYDTLVQALLLLEILAVLNIVLYAIAPYTFDWTKSRGAYALADSTKNLIANLKKETHIVVVMSQNDPVFRDLRNLMDNCQANSNKLKVDYLSPDNDPYVYAALVKKFPKIQSAEGSPFGPSASGKGMLLINGPMPKDEKHTTPYAFVSAQKFSEEDRAPRGDPRKSKKIFKGEGEITKELQFLVQGKKRKIYTLQGNDEPDIRIPVPGFRPDYRDSLVKVGFGAFVDKLNGDNYEVFGLSFGTPLVFGKEPPKDMVYLKAEGGDKKKDIPKDCDTLIVSQTPKVLPDEVVAAIERYMEARDGKLLVFLDVVAESDFSKLKNIGLEPLLKRFGVEVLDGFALSLPPVRNDPSLLAALGAERSENVLAKQFGGRSIIMPDSARVLKATDSANFKAEPVLQFEFREGSRHTLVETDIRPLQRVDLNFHLRELNEKRLLGARVNHEPVIVAVAVSEKDRPRLVVVGDTEFIGNQYLRASRFNYDFAASALEWMGDRDSVQSIGARPKESQMFSIDASVDPYRMILLPGWLMLLALTGIGIGIWVVRRR